MLNQVQRHPEWKLVVEALKDQPYGTLVSHDEMAMIAQLAARTPRYFAQVNKAGRQLLDWQKHLESVPSVGYRLVEPGEFHGRGRRQLRLAGRRLRMGAAIHAAAPQHLLTDAENTANANALAKIGALEAHRRRVVNDTRPAQLPPKPDQPKMLTV